MGFFKSDVFKIGVVVVVLMIVVYVMANTFIMGAFDLTAELQDRNEALNRKMANVLQTHRRVKTVFRQQMAIKEVECIASYIENNVDNLQLPEIKLVASSLVKYATKHDIPLSLAVAVAQTSSNFNPTLVDRHNRRGILALPSGISGDMTLVSARKLHEIDNNFNLGYSLLASKIEDKTYSPEAIAAFNAMRSNDTFVSNVSMNILNFDAFRSKYIQKWLDSVKARSYIDYAVKELAEEAAELKIQAKAQAEATKKQETPK